MPVFRDYMRSSDSTDFERTATLMDIEELTFGEEERTSLESHSSPPLVLDSCRHSALNGRGAATHSSTSHELRIEGNGHNHEYESGRMLVFRDQGVVVESGVQDEESRLRSFTFPARPHRRDIAYTERYPSIDGPQDENDSGKAIKFIPLRDEGPGISAVIARPANTNYQDLLQQLQTIAARRSSLLEELAGLQIEEVEVLAQLAQPTEPHSQPTSPPPASSAPPSMATSLPLRTGSTSRVPRLQSSMTSRKALYSRTLSAPTVSKRVEETGRSSAVETVKRVPLSEKIEDITKFKDTVRHSRSRSEVTVPKQETGQECGNLQSSNVLGRAIQEAEDIESLEGVAIVSDIPQEMRFPVSSRARAQSASSLKSQGSTKSQRGPKKPGRSKSRDSAKGTGIVKSQGRSKSQSSNKSHGRSKSQSRSKSRDRNRGRMTATAVQTEPALEQVNRTKVAPRVHLGKSWEF